MTALRHRPWPAACAVRRRSFTGRQTLLGKYHVAYYECTGCDSLQTEEPYWLEEAYRVEGLGRDVGACQRCLNLSLEVTAVLTVLGLNPQANYLDYGSGLGLFARMMRDRGWNFFAYDKFIKPFFMDQFLRPLAWPDHQWTALSAFEVFEHLVSPATELAQLFETQADAFFFTTQPWRGQGLDWWYIVPQGGQHVFFYSDKALQQLAEKHGYTLLELSSTRLFLNNRLAMHARPLSVADKIDYTFNRRKIFEVQDFFVNPAHRLHLLRDKKAMRKLAQKLFREHQRHSFKWTERDFEALTKLP